MTHCFSGSFPNSFSYQGCLRWKVKWSIRLGKSVNCSVMHFSYCCYRSQQTNSITHFFSFLIANSTVCNLWLCKLPWMLLVTAAPLMWNSQEHYIQNSSQQFSGIKTFWYFLLLLTVYLYHSVCIQCSNFSKIRFQPSCTASWPSDQCHCLNYMAAYFAAANFAAWQTACYQQTQNTYFIKQ